MNGENGEKSGLSLEKGKKRNPAEEMVICLGFHSLMWTGGEDTKKEEREKRQEIQKDFGVNCQGSRKALDMNEVSKSTC